MKGKDRHEFTRMGDENADFEPLICTDKDGIADADGADGGNRETCLPRESGEVSTQSKQ